MIHLLCLKLTATAVLLFVLVYFGVQVEVPRKSQKWFEAVMGSIFLIAILLFFGGGFGAIWTYPS